MVGFVSFEAHFWVKRVSGKIAFFGFKTKPLGMGFFAMRLGFFEQCLSDFFMPVIWRNIQVIEQP